VPCVCVCVCVWLCGLHVQRLLGSKVGTAQFVSATLPSNKFKNRLANILPCMFATYSDFVCSSIRAVPCRLDLIVIYRQPLYTDA